MRALVTGGTGFVASHVAEEFMRRGASVRVLARRSSDTSFLESIGAEIHFGELGDDDSFDAGLYGIDVVIHNAAVVGDWGRWADFERVRTRGTEPLLEAAEEYSLCPRHWRSDYYGRAKIAAERVVERFREEISVTVLRPTMVCGARDRSVFPRVAS